LLIGPIFTREAVIAPRRARLYWVRAIYVLALLVLVSTAWLVLTGTQLVRDVGDLSRFGMLLFQVLAPLQLALAMFFAALLAASNVAQEKERRTLELLLLTNLTNRELVLGKLLSGLLGLLVMLTAAVPLFALCALLGGVSFAQIGRVFAVTFASVLACGSLGTLVALAREKTFQSLAMTVLVLVLWLLGWQIVSTGIVGDQWWGVPCRALATGFSPWLAVLEASRPAAGMEPSLSPIGTPVHLFLVVAVAGAALMNATAIAMVRVWNPSHEVQRLTAPGESGAAVGAPLPQQVRSAVLPHDADAAKDRRCETDPGAGGWIGSPPAAPATVGRAGVVKSRRVWDNPVLWREVRTWAYGRKMLMIRLAYLALFAVAAGSLGWMMRDGPLALGQGALAMLPLLVLSLVLVNTQAVTALTSERDAHALDLLLVTDLSPREIVFGKLAGILYNTKEMVVLPLLACVSLWLGGAMNLENTLYLMGGLGVLYVFVAVLGVHAGIHYANSRSAVAVSLGTVFFLLLGVATCMRMMIAFAGSFQAQLQPFLAFMIGGGIGLYLALGARNPSTAIAVASLVCPFATFYAITSFLMNRPLGVFLVTVAAYGFTSAAMLVPAIYEFDVATGRTSLMED